MPNVTFLDPMAGIIAAGLSVPILVALYLLKLRRRPARVSSTLLWEQAVQDLQANVPFRWVRPSWLLLLQLLVLAALIAALARPALDAPGPGGDLVVIAIDASGSMRARDARAGDPEPVTRLEDAKRRARDLVARIRGSGAQAMVVSIAATPEARTEWSRDAALLRRAIDAIEPTDQEADFDAALATIDALVHAGGGAGDAPTTRPPRVVLISDGDLQQTPASDATLGDTPIDFIRVGPSPTAERDNLGIAAISARRDIDDPSLVRVFVRVVNAAASPRNVGVLLTLDAQGVDAATLDVPARDEHGPGSASATFDLLAERGLVVARLAIADALDADNTASLVINPPAGVRIALVTPAELSTPSEWALYDALSATRPEAIEPMSEQAFQARSQAGDLPFDLIVFDRVRPQSLPTLPSLSLGATLPVPGLDTVAGSGGVQEVAFWQRTHPLMRGVSLNTLVMSDPPVLRVPDTGAGPAAAPTILASTIDGGFIALLERGGVARIVVATPLASTNWTTQRSFPVFIANAVDLLAGARGGDGEAFTTSEPISIAAPQGAAVRVSGPHLDRRATVAPSAKATLTPIPRAGVYQLEIEGSAPRPLSVNMVSDRESSIATADAVQVAGREAAAGRAGGSAPREVWAWLVLAAAVLQLLEWTLFSLRARV